MLLALLGVAVGAYGTIIGAGGGFALVPLLLIIYPDYGPEQVTAVSLAVVCASGASGSLAYARQRRIDYVTGLLFVVSSVPGVVGGALLVHLVPARLFSLLFALLLLAVAALVLRRPAPRVVEPLAGRGVLVRTMAMPDGSTYRYAYRVWQVVALGLAVGFASSLFGIGGGVIQVPALVVVFRVPVALAVATSQFVLACMTGGGTAVHLANGTLAGEQLRQAVAVGAGAVLGAQGGAWLSRRLTGADVLRLLALALVFLAGWLALKGVFDL